MSADTISFQCSISSSSSSRARAAIEQILEHFSRAVDLQMFRALPSRDSSCAFRERSGSTGEIIYACVLGGCSAGALHIFANLIENLGDLTAVRLHFRGLDVNQVRLLPFPQQLAGLQFPVLWNIGSDRFELLIRVEFARPVSEPEEHEILAAVRVWDWIVAQGGYPDIENTERTTHLGGSEAYFVSPTTFEHPTYGFLANLESVHSLVNCFSFVSEKWCEVASMEIV